MQHYRFHDRAHAGRELAALLTRYADRPDVLVLALPRGGLPVAAVVAEALRAPLDVFLVRKLGLPGHEELAMGAIASGGLRVLNDDVISMLGVAQRTIDRVAQQEQRELERREREYRDAQPPPQVEGRTCILIDDGLATGATMRAAARALRQRGPARVVVAVPTAAPATCAELGQEVDEIVCAITPEPFHAVGLWYENFEQTGDDEVRALLRAARQRQAQHPAGAQQPHPAPHA